MGGEPSRWRSALIAALLVLPVAAAVAAPVSAVRILDYGLLGAAPVQTLELTFPVGAPPGTTIELPLNASATILDASVDLFGAPSFNTTLLRGWGTLERNREDFGLPMHRGDFNGDGLSDLVVGAPMRDVPDSPGRVEVYYGRTGALNPTADWQYIGPSGIQFAGALSSADLNGDSFDDLIVGEQNWGYQGTPPEEAFVFFGTAGGLPAAPSLVFQSDDPLLETGYANAVTAADLNADGYGDLVVAELQPGLNALNSRLWIYWGGPTGPNASNYSFAYAPGPDFFEFGFPFYPIGDSDGDGQGELYTGSVAYHDRTGGAVVLEGIANSTATNLVWDWNGSQLSTVVRDGFSAGHDITGDGLADIVVGYNAANDTRGGLYWVPGLANGSYNTSARVRVLGENPGDSFATSSLMGDIDADGLGDLVVGATHTYSDAEGSIYLFSGGDLGMEKAGRIPLGLTGAAEGCGESGAYLGDVNGDGVGDFAFACTFGVNGSYTPGTVHVFYGNRHPFPENASFKVGGDVVWNRSGPMKGPVLAPGLGSALSSYLTAHAGEADAAGTVRIPLTFEFENGGKLQVARIYVRYTVLLEPGSVVAYSDPSGEAVVVSWAVRSSKSDGDMTAVWSNKTTGVWSILANVSSSRGSYVDLDVVRGTTYWYAVTEWDALLGRHGPPSANVSATATDSKPPNPPVLQPLTIDAPARAVTLRWGAATDDTARWEVWRRDGDVAPFVRVGNVSRATLAYFDAGLNEEINLTWRVAAVDGAGIASAFSEERTARLPDLEPPPQPQGLTGRAEPSGTEVTLSWTANTYDTVGYAVNVSAPGTPSGFQQAGTTSSTSFKVVGLQRAATYYLQVRALDRAGQRSAAAQVTVVTADAQAPAVPIMNVPTPLPAGRAVHATWEAADDDIATFHISWKQGGLNGPGANVPGDTYGYIVAGLVNDLPVEIRVSAVDGGGFQSADSAPVTAVPHDLLPPGVPTGVRVVALPEGGALRVEWSPPGDADVVGYNVWFAPQASAGAWTLAGAVGGGALTFEKRGLRDLDPYTFVVSAIDEVANEGNFSAPVSGTPHDSQPPAVPRFDTFPEATKESQLDVTGRVDPSVDVEFTLNGVTLDLVRADGAGRFLVTLNLRDGANTFAARAIDPDSRADPEARTSPDTAVASVVRDGVAPRVTSTTPSAGAEGVLLRPTIEATFSELPLASSVVAVLRSSTGEEISTQLTLDVAQSTLLVTPQRDLTPGERYTLTLSATDAAGNALAFAPLTFTTQSAGGSDTGLFAASAGVVGAAAAVALVRRRRAGRRDD